MSESLAERRRERSERLLVAARRARRVGGLSWREFRRHAARGRHAPHLSILTNISKHVQRPIISYCTPTVLMQLLIKHVSPLFPFHESCTQSSSSAPRPRLSGARFGFCSMQSISQIKSSPLHRSATAPGNSRVCHDGAPQRSAAASLDIYHGWLHGPSGLTLVGS